RGGKASAPFRVTIDPGGANERVLPGLVDDEPIPAGTLVRVETTGGGGWGDPLEREPELVALDVLQGKVSARSAREDYGIVLATAVTCCVVTWQTRSAAAGIGAGMLAAAILALLLVYYAVALRGPQITVGLGLYVLGVGLSSLIFRVVFGVRTTPPQIQTLAPMPVPGIADLPVIGPVLFQQTLLTYLAFLLVPVVHLALFRTPWG